MRSAKTGQTLWMDSLIRVFTGRTSLIVGFVVHWLIFLFMKTFVVVPGVILEGDLGEKVSLSWLTSPYLELWKK